MSSDPSQPQSSRHAPAPPASILAGATGNNAAVQHYECAVCYARFVTGALLHQHLQQAQHYKPHSHRFMVTGTGESCSSAAAPTATPTGAASGGEQAIFYCDVCSIAVNSQTQLHAHNAAHRHRARAAATTIAAAPVSTGAAAAGSVGQQPPRSFSQSSTSSETLPNGNFRTCPFVA
jgi:hypothetical protein